MVLFKRKPVQFISSPDIPDSSQEVWVIPLTREIFTSYEAYLTRIDFYKQKRFICEITGHSNLTFFEAHQSETNGAKDVDETFPDALKEPVLRKVQFQTISRVDNLVDHLFDLFKNDFYPGETVTAFLSNGDRTEAIIREKCRFPELRNPVTNELERKAHSTYVVKLPNRDDAETNLTDDQLVRDRKIFTKAMLRSFIKNTVSREAWTGAPWVVKEQYAKKYKIDMNIPSHLMRGLTAADRKAALARRKEEEASLMGLIQKTSTGGPSTPAMVLDIRPIPSSSKSHKSKTQQAAKTKGPGSGSPSTSGDTPERESLGVSIPLGKMAIKQEVKPAPKPPPLPVIRYPIEDLQIIPKPDSTVRPALHFITSSGFTDEMAHFILESWVFLNIYCEPFLLDSFTFDDYLDALHFNSDDTDCELIVEIHCALLKGIVGEGENGKVDITLPELPDSDDESEEGSSESRQSSERAEDQTEVKARNRGRGKGTDEDEDVEMDDGEKDGNDEGDENRAGELFNDGYDWITRLRRRDFRNGGWQVIIVGLLDQLAILPKYTADCKKILSHLAPMDQEPTKETVSLQYSSLDANLKAKIIKILVGLAYDVPLVRKYMEECAEAMTELRKKKIEHQRARKVHLEELRQLEDERKILLPENTPRSASPDQPGRSPSKSEDIDRMIGTEDELDETGEDTDNRRSLRRGDERANARKRKREQDREKAEAAAKQPKTSQQFQRVLKNIEKTRTKISKEEEEIATIDADLREADCARLRLLGKDRFYNRYWWFERNGMPYGGLPTSSTANSGYANGRLWIQGPSDMEREGFLEQGPKGLESRGSGDRMEIDSGHDSGMTILMEKKYRDEGTTSLRYAHQFGYYEEPEELDSLIGWLDPRGERELKLKKELELYRKKIVEGMENRKNYLMPTEDGSDADSAVVTRMSTRGKTSIDSTAHRCLNWTNIMAVDENGHTHYNQPVKKAKGRKSTENKDAASSRNGKPLGRQGTRYNF